MGAILSVGWSHAGCSKDSEPPASSPTAAGGAAGAPSVCRVSHTEDDGDCVDTRTDPDHCGACDEACADDEVCSRGECSIERADDLTSAGGSRGTGGRGGSGGERGKWAVNHGHHLLSNGNFLFFNNGDGAVQSPVLELELTEPEARVVWSYTSEYSSPTLGDVQRLPNGNTLITYSNAG